MFLSWDEKASKLKIKYKAGLTETIKITAANYEKVLEDLSKKTEALEKGSVDKAFLEKTFKKLFPSRMDKFFSGLFAEAKPPVKKKQAVAKPAVSKDSVVAEEAPPRVKKEPVKKIGQPDTLKNQLALITLREQLIDSIERLRKTSRDGSLAMDASEPKIQVLTKLLQIITAPTAEQKARYYNGNEAVKLSELMAQFLSEVHPEIQYKGEPVTHYDVLNAPRYKNDLDVAPTDRARTTTARFMHRLQAKAEQVSLSQTPMRSKPAEGKTSITSVVVMGDSLSDEGQMMNSKFGGWSGIDKYNSSEGSFSNGFVWTDNFFNMFADETLEKHYKTKGKWRDDDIADLIAARKGTKFDKEFRNLFNLDNDREFRIGNRTLARIYAIGGLTSDNYFGKLSQKFSLTMARLFVSTLGAQRANLLMDDKKASRSAKEKAETLVIEWSGANDLITVNERPAFEAADNSIKARAENVNEMVKNGYKNIVLFNLPDLSKTPRYRAMSDAERENAKKVTDYYNQALDVQRAQLQEMHPDCKIEIFDVHTHFNDILAKPEDSHYNTEFELKAVDKLPLPDEAIKNNQVYFTLFNRSVGYQVKDPCGQIQSINFNLPEDCRTEAQIHDRILQHAREQGHIIVSEAYMNANPDCGYDSLLTPFKSTQAFQRFEAKAVKKGEPLHVLSSLNMIFYDDVHPTSDTHMAIFNRFKDKFFNKKFEFTPPDIKLTVQTGKKQAAEAPEPRTLEKARLIEKSTAMKQDLQVFKEPLEARRARYTCAFVELYLNQWRADKAGAFGLFERRGLKEADLVEMDLEAILEHAKSPNHKRSRNILINEGWMTKEGALSDKIKPLLEGTRFSGISNLSEIEEPQKILRSGFY